MFDMKTLYISDLDGTLLNPSAQLGEYSKDILNEMIIKGFNFSVATARTAASVNKILEGLKFNLPIVLMNGVLVYDFQNKCHIKINRLSSETVAAIIRILKSFSITGLMYQLKDDVLTTYYESLEPLPIRHFVEERINRYYKTFSQIDNFTNIPSDHIVYFTILNTYSCLKPVYDALSALQGINMTMYKDIYSDDTWYLEIFSEEASKHNAAAFLRQEYGFQCLIGFGDNLNDLPLFKACDIKVAVENAKDQVKSAADFVCNTNYNDGVVKWIMKNTGYGGFDANEKGLVKESNF